jgi:alpha-1,2-mannosyltransferase
VISWDALREVGVLARLGEQLAARRVSGFAVAYLLSAGLCCVLAMTGRAHFADLHVYRLGGEAVARDLNLYQVRYAGLPFTYTPFAAVCFTTLAALPWRVAVALLTVASAAALPLMLYLALRLPSGDQGRDRNPDRNPDRNGDQASDRANAWRLALTAAVAAVWLEPVRTTFGYGQIDLLLALGVLADLSLPDRYRYKGALIGLAAGLKLTPAIFVAYLLLTRRYRAAATATGVFAATIGAGSLLLPSGSAFFWDVTFIRPGRISPVQNPENQGVLGALARTLHTPHVTSVWLPAAVVIALTGLVLAARAQRGGNEALGFSLCAITGLLISPISWTHHWVIAIPGLLIAAACLYRHRARVHPCWLACGAAGLGAVAVLGWLGVARRVHGADWLHLSAFGIAASEVYVIAALVGLAVAAVLALASGLDRPRARSRTWTLDRPRTRTREAEDRPSADAGRRGLPA